MICYTGFYFVLFYFIRSIFGQRKLPALTLMSPKLQYWVRWIAVLPGAIIAGIISMFIVHLVLYNSLKEIIQPYPELPERILTPLVASATIIIAGSWIAPDKKEWTSIFLFGLWAFVSGGIVLLTLMDSPFFGYKLSFQIGGLPTLGAIAGAVFGLYKVRRAEKDKD